MAATTTRAGEFQPRFYLEDLEVGDTWVSVGRTITESDIVNFAGISGDFNPIHLDVESSAKSRYGQRVAHGILGISVATGLIDSLGVFRDSMIAMLGIDEWRFRAPVFIGDTIHLELSIAEIRPTSEGNRGIVRRKLTLVNQREEIVQEGYITVMIRARGEE